MPSRTPMRWFAAAWTLTLTGIVVALALQPTHDYGVIPARPVILPGHDTTNSHVLALAVLPKGATTWQAVTARYNATITLGPTSESAHAHDAQATRSREVADYAANNILGAVPARWMTDHHVGDYWTTLTASLSAITVTACAHQNELTQTACVINTVETVQHEYVPEHDTFSSRKTLRKELKRRTIHPGQWRPVPTDTTGTPAINLNDWVGGSAGLAYTLAYLDDRLNGTLIPDGMLLAATGTVDAAPFQPTRVGPVNGIATKLEGAALAGATVAFVPAGQTPPDPAVPTVEVATVEDAVTWLCLHGSDAPICPDLTSDGADTGR